MRLRTLDTLVSAIPLVADSPLLVLHRWLCHNGTCTFLTHLASLTWSRRQTNAYQLLGMLCLPELPWISGAAWYWLWNIKQG